MDEGSDSCPSLPSTGLTPLWRLNSTKERHPDGHWHGTLTPLTGRDGPTFVAVGDSDIQVGVKLYQLFDHAKRTLPAADHDAFWDTYVESIDEVPEGPDVFRTVDL